jgi:hypothetical protein
MSTTVTETKKKDRQWVPIGKRRGYSKIPHNFKGTPGALAVYRVGVSFPPQLITGTRTRFDGMTLHVLSMSALHLAEDSRMYTRTILRWFWNLIGDGWAACLRRGKKGRKSVAVYVFLTAEDRARLWEPLSKAERLKWVKDFWHEAYENNTPEYEGDDDEPWDANNLMWAPGEK